jgi:hypothetical protein
MRREEGPAGGPPSAPGGSGLAFRILANTTEKRRQNEPAETINRTASSDISDQEGRGAITRNVARGQQTLE